MSPKKTGEIFNVKGAQSSRTEPRIVGALPITEKPPETLDSRTPQESTPVETTVHGEAVTVREHVRAKPRRKDEPDVRVRMMSREEREAWDRARRAED